VSSSKNIAVDFVVPSLSRLGGGITSSSIRLAQNLMSDATISVSGLADRHTADDLDQWNPLHVKSFKVLGPRAFGFAPNLLSFAAPFWQRSASHSRTLALSIDCYQESREALSGYSSRHAR